MAAAGDTTPIRLHPHSLSRRTAAGWLLWFREGMHDRISQGIPYAERGLR